MIIDPEKIVINNRGLLSRSRRICSALVLAALWCALAYLAYPLARLAWLAGAVFFDPALADMEPLRILKAAFNRYPPIIMIMSLSLFGWAMYNRLRFSGLRDKRRAAAPAVAVAETAAAFSLASEQLRLIRRAEVSFFFFDDAGAIKAVKCCQARNDNDSVLSRAMGKAFPAAAAHFRRAAGSPEPPGR